jgi:hypothetical protein
MNVNIVESTLRALDSLQDEFRAEPTLFFTEHDLASRAYQLIQQELGHPKARDADGKTHYLVHHEYPTPFRCDMRGVAFAVKGDDIRTPQKGKYRRGHYDLVVFNPKFLQKCKYNLAKGQNFKSVNEEIPALINIIGTAPILLGVEFAFRRDPFHSQKAIDRWWDEVLQDYEKLQASRTWKDRPFIQEIMVMAFDASGEAAKNDRVRDDITRVREIRYSSPFASDY